MIPPLAALGPIFMGLLCAAGVLRAETKVGETWIRVDSRESEIIRNFDVSGDRTVVVGIGGMLATSQDDGIWEQATTHGPTFNSIASGGGCHVAAGSGDSCYSSSDGVHWIRRFTGTGATWSDVAWVGDRFVMVGTSGTIVTSSNGVDWSRESSGTPQSLLKVTMESGVVQILAANGTILKSSVPGTWQSTASSTLTFSSFAVRNGRTVAGGPASTTGLRYRDDDGTWIKSTIVKAGDSTTSFRFVVSGSTGFVALNEGGELLHSEDGTLWHQRILPIADDPVAVKWTGSEFVGVTANREFVRSPDGRNWSANRMDRAADSVWSGSLHVVVGPSGFIARSTDGVHWTSSVSGTVNDLRGVAWSGTRFIATGVLGTLLSSEDGITWSAVPTGNWDLNGITWTGTRFIALASKGMILASDDGLIWTISDPGRIDAVIWDGTRYVAVHHRSALASPDGEAWHFLGPMEMSASSTPKFRDIVWTGSLYVAVGEDSYFMSSPDGITWTKRTPPGSTTSNNWYSVAWSGQKLIAVGSDHYARSTDGLTWTTTSTGPYFEAVAWTGTRWIGCGRGKTGYSLDGETWVQQGPGILPNLRCIAHGGARYVAGGSNGSSPVILSSVDGVAWTTHTFTGGRWINDVAWTGERYVAALSDGRYLVSPDGSAWEEIAGATTTEKQFLVQRNDGVAAFARSGQAEFTEDGTTWEAGVSRSGASDFGYVTKVRHFPGRTIAVGYNDVAFNTGGNSWVRYPFVGTGLQARDVVLFDGKYVLMCDTKLLESADGLDWVPWTGSRLPGASDFWGIGITPQGRLLIVRSVAGDWELRRYDAVSGWSPLMETQHAYPTCFNIVGDRLFGCKGGSSWSEDDGLTWNPPGPLPRVNVGLLNVAAFSGGFVATGEYGRLMLSENDGQNWEGIPTFVENYFYAVAGHDSRLVAMMGGLKTSTDGRTWEPVAGGPINGFKLEWTGNKFTALNYSSLGYVSADGISWQENPAAVGVTSIAGVDGRVVGMSSTRNVWSGEDVTTIRQRGIFDFHHMASSGNEYVALSSGPWRSENLIDWDYRGNAGTAPSGVAWTGSRFVTVGGSASNPGYSADGVNWTTVPSTNGIAVIWTGDRLYSFDNSGVVRTSPDGSAWTVVPDDTSQALFGAAWAGGFGVAVGNAGTVLRSTDGSAWTTVASGVTVRLNSVTWTGAQVVAVGNGGVVASSPDGLAWQSVSVGSTSILNSVTSHDGLLVTVSDTGEIFTSSDGATWTKRFGSAEHSFLHVNWARDRFVALGRAGAVVTSSDGMVWEPILRAPGNMSIYRTSAGFTESFVAAGASGSRFLALGSVGSILHSSDGKVWHEAGRPVTTALRDAVWVDGTFIVVGDGGVILTSPDGMQWTKRETGRFEDLVAVSARGETVVAVGDRGLVLRSERGFALPTSYEEWSEPIADTQDAPDHDGDGDGFSNLVAYSMGWPAGTAASAVRRSTLPAVRSGASRELVFSLGAEERFGIRYEIERSSSLSTWTRVATRTRGAWSGTLASAVTESVDGMGRRSISIALPAAVATGDYYRVRFVAVAP